ncbi:MAG: Holliday junction branch migration protein RuvA [Bacteroidota bacterium]
MITHLNGRLVEKYPTHVVIECGGIGYLVHISLHSYEHLPQGEACKILTYLSIKEDSHSLYGFMTESERTLFLLLISVSGVGTNTARLILSSLTPGDVVQAIAAEDDRLLTKIKGLGPKTAKRLILELKDKVDKVGGENLLPQGNKVKQEALSGLLVLGFDKRKAELAVDSAWSANPSCTVEELIKTAIKTLY